MYVLSFWACPLRLRFGVGAFRTTLSLRCVSAQLAHASLLQAPHAG